MRAFIVSVDYSDLLEVTLPYNRHHFDEVTVITSLSDTKTRSIAKANDCSVFQTDSFYDDGAAFNKWKALELGLNAQGRHGVICLLDADILWPRSVPRFTINSAYLYTPKRRMMDPVRLPVPEEHLWNRYPLHRQQREFAGYTQIFHGKCPFLGDPPWHQIDWKHAGGADSFFQQKWPSSYKIRPPFEVLHLGPAGTNWMGRASAYTNGAMPDKAQERLDQLRKMMRARRTHQTFDHEKVEKSK